MDLSSKVGLALTQLDSTFLEAGAGAFRMTAINCVVSTLEQPKSVMKQLLFILGRIRVWVGVKQRADAAEPLFGVQVGSHRMQDLFWRPVCDDQSSNLPYRL